MMDASCFFESLFSLEERSFRDDVQRLTASSIVALGLGALDDACTTSKNTLAISAAFWRENPAQEESSS